VDRALRRAMFVLPGKAGIFLASSDGNLAEIAFGIRRTSNF
jgi:hypothetical protein